MGPIIEAIDAGHVDHDGECPRCTKENKGGRVAYPCPAMREARKAQAHYADDLRINNLLDREARRTYI